MTPSFRILGPLAAGDVALGGPRQRAVLAVLLLAPGRVVTAESIATAVWGEDAPPSTVKSVRSYASRLRSVLGAEMLQPRRTGFVLAVGGEAVDAGVFERLVAAARSARGSGDVSRAGALFDEALQLWRGRVLEDLPELGSHPEVRRLEDLRLEALEERSETKIACGDGASVVAELEALAHEHPLRERVHEQLMRGLYLAGRQADALAAYARARAALDEVGLEPSPALADLQGRILRHEVDDRRETPTNLPAPVSSFVGREEELDAVADRLRGARLVTITGIGGGGKTRVAIEVARRERERYSGGVWFVDLAPVRDREAVLDELARAVGAAAVGAPPLEAAWRRISTSETLLVVDNAEHVVDACAAALSELLARAPGARALVTSRRPLGLPGEVLYVLPPLRDDASKLFVERARAADTAVELDADAVASVCAMVDGIPLAVEFLAARVRALEVPEIRDTLALEGPLAWPAGGATQRHHSLRNALAWSYDLLSPAGRKSLPRLSVFAGGFTLAAAAAVVPDESVVELVDASLLVVESRTPVRYRMLDTVRAYARELLADDADDAARDHASHFLARAEEAFALAFAPGEDSALAALDEDYDELRAALSWSLGGRDPALGVRLARALTWFWPTRGHLVEGRSWLRRAVDAAQGADDVTADLLGGLGLVSYRLAEWDEAAHLLESAADSARRCDATLAEGRWLHYLAGALRGRGDRTGASAAAAASLAVKERCGDDAGIAWTLGLLADTAQDAGELDGAAELYDRGLGFVHAAGDPPRLVVGYTASLAQLAVRTGDAERADALAREALVRAERLGERWHVATARMILADAARLRGDEEAAAAHARAALREAEEVNEAEVARRARELLAASA